MIRRAKEEDIDSIISLLNEVLYTHYLLRPDIFKEKGSKFTKDELKEMINSDDTLIFVYEKDNIVISHAIVKIKDIKNESNRNDRKTFFIEDFVVKKEERRKGIGKEFINFLINYAKEINSSDVALNVWNKNLSAKKFYKSLGFKPRSIILEKIL